jgi:hypothetical protein
VRERLPWLSWNCAKSIERLKCTATCTDDRSPGHPVGALAMNEVPTTSYALQVFGPSVAIVHGRATGRQERRATRRRPFEEFESERNGQS